MQKIILCAGVILMANTSFSQRTMEKLIDKLSNKDVPLASVTEVSVNPSYIRLDAREREEYEVSHLPDAKYIGYTNFDIDQFTSLFPDKEATYLVYCSLGIRSGKIGERLIELGYSDVKNMSGGIFKWMEEDLPVVDADDRETKRVHAYNKFWGLLLTKGEKVYSLESEEKDER
ncbi:rhodanese-like domain-containing protein [Muriicola soli]|uniref:Rhodanese-like domain-containing protein n=1 Tax=Muriicola soli TaxID=2507538 RepID=A0A411EBI7_9FLAO|nr:rhodanese-like domain-containing protein [Muriicola soli]QBA65029.1 rhodanese-like domain-containing protein [Muriicola soli]